MTTVLIGDELITYIHDPILKPAAKAKGVEFREWKELFVWLLQLAKEQGAFIAGYSIPEREYLYEANPDQREFVDKIYFNANAASWFRNKRPDTYERIKSTMPKFRKPGLKQFLLLPEVELSAYPKYLVHAEFSPAKALKQAREQLIKYHGKYSDISKGTRQRLSI
jgi:predicted amidohydrolase